MVFSLFCSVLLVTFSNLTLAVAGLCIGEWVSNTGPTRLKSESSFSSTTPHPSTTTLTTIKSIHSLLTQNNCRFFLSIVSSTSSASPRTRAWLLSHSPSSSFLFHSFHHQVTKQHFFMLFICSCTKVTFNNVFSSTLLSEFCVRYERLEL